MQVNQLIGCRHFPCGDVRHECYVVPDVDVDPQKVSIVLISESAPADPADFYYAAGNPLFAQTTVQAFRDAGTDVASVADILRMGVYLTAAVKCGKTGYGIETATVKECARILEKEIALFPNVRALLLASAWALVPAVLLAILLIVRTRLEDQTLQEELPGYVDYAGQVRYRLFPGIW